VRLLNRTTRQVNVTADGAACYERVVRLLAGIDDADTSLSGAAALPRGRLRIDVPAPLARLLLVPALPAFLARYPDIQLDLGVSDRTVDLIGENADAVLRGGPIRDPSLVARRIGDLQAGLYAALIAALVPAAPAFAQEPAATPTPDRTARLPLRLRPAARPQQCQRHRDCHRRWLALRDGPAGCRAGDLPARAGCRVAGRQRRTVAAAHAPRAAPEFRAEDHAR